MKLLAHKNTVPVFFGSPCIVNLLQNQWRLATVVK